MHEPRVYMGGGEAWIQCSCGFNRDGLERGDGIAWTNHLMGEMGASSKTTENDLRAVGTVTRANLLGSGQRRN